MKYVGLDRAYRCGQWRGRKPTSFDLGRYGTGRPKGERSGVFRLRRRLAARRGFQWPERGRNAGRRAPDVAKADNEGWSLYGARWLQPVATTGKSRGPVNRKSKPNPLPPAATGCLRTSMVRRGSTVRVRQRASRNALQSPTLRYPNRQRLGR